MTSVPRHIATAVRFTCLAAFAACASPGAPRDDAAPTTLGVRFPTDATLRFVRTVESSARSAGLRVRDGELNGVDVRYASEYLVQCHSAGDQDNRCGVRLGAFAMEMRGLRGNVSLDSRRPETIAALEASAEGREALAVIRGKQSQESEYRVARDGTAKAPDGGEPAPADTPVFDVGWFPGTLPLGRLAGAPQPGAAWEFRGHALDGGLAGLHHSDPVPVAGRWQVAAWDAASRTAHLTLDGGAATEGTQLATTRIERCTLQGAATWDARRGCVTACTVTAHVVLRTHDGRIRIDWTLRQEEHLEP